VNIPIWFHQEEGKKSSFIIDPPLPTSSSSASNSAGAQSPRRALHHGLEKPAHAIIDCCCVNNDKNSIDTVPFLFAGMEIVSNSRNIEMYSTDDEGNEKYLFTSRGMKFETDDDATDYNGPVADFGMPRGLGGEPPTKAEWYKCVMINPGGPETVRSLHLKLLSLRPARASRVNIRLLKLKGRISTVEELKANPQLVEEERKPTTEKKNGSSISAPTRPPMSAEEISMLKNALMEKAGVSTALPPSLNLPNATMGAAPTAAASQSDMGTAIAAVTMMVRSTEERLARSVTTSIGTLEQTTTSSFRFMELKMQSMEKALATQQETMENQDQLIKEQSRMLESQREMMESMMESMMEGQKLLLESVAALKQHQEEAEERSIRKISDIMFNGCNGIKSVEQTNTNSEEINIPNEDATKDIDETPLEVKVSVSEEYTEVVDTSSSENIPAINGSNKTLNDGNALKKSIMEPVNKSQNDPFAALADEDLLGFGDESDFSLRASTNVNLNQSVVGGEIQDLLGLSDEIAEVPIISNGHNCNAGHIPNGKSNDDFLSGLKEEYSESSDDAKKNEGSVYDSVTKCLGFSLQ